MRTVKVFFLAGLLLVVVCAGVACKASSAQAGSISSSASAASSHPPAPQQAATAWAGASLLTGLPLPESAAPARRPLAVMVDNVRAALPQRGLSAADIVYEMVTESGITRLMAVYADYTAMPSVGPVRSARDQHVQLMLPLNALYLYVGGSTYANEMLERYHYDDKSINGYYEAGALELDADRSAAVAVEHCWFTNGQLFTDAAATYQTDTALKARVPAFQFVPYTDEPRVLRDGAAAAVHVRFSSYTNCTLQYNPQTLQYEKFQFDAPQMDENTGTQLAFDNALVLFTDITRYPDGVLANVRYAYGGVGFYFNRGSYEKVRWVKGAPEEPLRIVSLDGTETLVPLNPGTTYVAMVDLGMYPHFRIAATAAMPGNHEMPVQPGDTQEASDDA